MLLCAQKQWGLKGEQKNTSLSSAFKVHYTCGRMCIPTAAYTEKVGEFAS
jgi:hypothetical protein